MPSSPSRDALRAFLVVRSRYAEDQLASAVDARRFANMSCWARDSIRSLTAIPFRPPGSTFSRSIIRPRRNGSARNCVKPASRFPPTMTFAAVDFERQSLDDGLRAAGFDKQRPAFFSWLGVTPYLSRAAFDATIQFIASLPSSSGVVFDFAVERSLLSPPQQLALDALAARVARAGEPFQLFFDPVALARGPYAPRVWEHRRLKRRSDQRALLRRPRGRPGRLRRRAFAELRSKHSRIAVTAQFAVLRPLNSLLPMCPATDSLSE